MPEHPQPVPPPRRRWFRFSIRTLLVGVTLLCIALGLLARDLYRYHRRHELIARIDAADGRTMLNEYYWVFGAGDNIEYRYLSYSERLLGWWYDSEQELLVLAEVELSGGNRDALLQDLAELHSLNTLHLRNVEITDNTVRALQRMTSLQELYVNSERITPQELARLAKLPVFQELRLENAAANDANLEVVQQISALTRLSLTDGTISDEGLKSVSQSPGIISLDLISLDNISHEGIQDLAKLSSLQFLQLNSVPMTDATFEAVGQIHSLSNLQVAYIPSDSQFSPEAVRHLVNLKSLETLEIPTVPLDDNTLQYVAQLPLLGQLSCDGSGITDAGLVHFKGLSELETLRIPGAQISMEGLKQLSILPQLAELEVGTLKLKFDKDQFLQIRRLIVQ